MSTNVSAILLKGQETCTLPSILHEAKPIVGDWTLHSLLSLVAGITTILTLMISSTALFGHLRNYTVPIEQRHIVRVLLTPLIFSIFSFFSIWFYSAAPYLTSVAQLYEVFALVAVFLLFLAFVCADSAEYENFFANLERRKDYGGGKKHNHGSLKWFYYVWVMVFQILVTRLACSVALWIINATMCPLDPKLDNAKIAIEVIESVFTVFTITSIIRFYRRLSPQLKERKALSKLLMFKLIVFVQLLQNPLFSGLIGGGVLEPTEYISYQDWSIGVPAFCTCGEMFIFSIIFSWPFTAKPYSYRGSDVEKLGIGRRVRLGKLGFFAAFVDAINISDVVSGAFFQNKVIGLFAKDTTRRDRHQQQGDQIALRSAYREISPSPSDT